MLQLATGPVQWPQRLPRLGRGRATVTPTALGPAGRSDVTGLAGIPRPEVNA